MEQSFVNINTMQFYAIFLLVYSVGIHSCKENNANEQSENCSSSVLDGTLAYNDMISEIPQEIFSALAESSDKNGALGRNKDGYVHVRFQMGMNRLSDYAVVFQDEEAVAQYLDNLHYSFSHQRPGGDFEFIPPDYVIGDPNYKPPSLADLASGTAFFAYSLGLSLQSLNQSEWYVNNGALATIRTEIENLNPKIQALLQYLKRSADLLNHADGNAPNRLFFNALSFYALGEYLNDPEAKSTGISFAQKALSLRNQDRGYFMEGGGWDSSYNGVSIKLGFELYTMLNDSVESNLKSELEAAVSCATDWQATRVMPSGEISTQGNTRVFPGGEEFLGNEKQVDVVKTVKAFYYMGILADDSDYVFTAERVLEYYEQ